MSREELLAELRARDERRAHLYDEAPLGCCTLDAQGIIRELNLTAAAMLGRERRHLLGWPLEVAARLPSRSLRAHLRSARRRPQRAEFTLRPAGAEPRPVEVISLPGEGGLHMMLIDRSLPARAEAGLRQQLEAERRARAEAEAVGQAKDAFLAQAAHELGTPLAAMTVWLHILRSAQGAERDSALEILEQCTRAQTRQVEDLLEVARGRRGRLRVALGPLDPWPAVEQALQAMRPRAEARGLRLSAHPAPGLGRVWADPARLRQIVTNLLANALQFTPPQGEVSVQLTPTEFGVRLTVRDTGRGLSAEELRRMFTSFWPEGDPLSQDHGGLGLGLAIVKELVEAHGGEVHAESAGLGQGTAFVVQLRAAPARPISVPPPSLGGARVLVVEEDELARQGLLQLLQRAGGQPSAASSAGAAWEQLQEAAPELVLLNIDTSGADGLLLRLRARGAGPPVVSLSSSEHPDAEAAALNAGARLHLRKPVEANELLRSVLKALQGRPESPALR